MIEKEKLLKSLKAGGSIDKAASIVAKTIKDSDVEKRREFVYEYRALMEKYESYSDSIDDEEEVMPYMKRVLVYSLAFKKLGIDPERVLGKK